MNKQILFGFVIFSLTAMMITSQMPEAYAADQNCVNETLTGDLKKTNIHVTTQSSFNICVIDGVTLQQGNIFVEENAAVLIMGGTTIKGGDIILEGDFSAVNFEGPTVSTLDGNIFGGVNSYIFLDAVTITGNVDTTGEVYFSSQPSRFTGPTKIVGNLIVQASDNTNEFVMAGGEVTGSVKVFNQLSVRVFDATIGGLEIINSVNTSADGLISVENNQIGSTLKLEGNTMSTVLLKDNAIGQHLLLTDNPSSIELDGNTISKNANCKGNTSVFGNSVVNGQAQLDCAFLKP